MMKNDRSGLAQYPVADSKVNHLRKGRMMEAFVDIEILKHPNSSR